VLTVLVDADVREGRITLDNVNNVKGMGLNNFKKLLGFCHLDFLSLRSCVACRDVIVVLKHGAFRNTDTFSRRTLCSGVTKAMTKESSLLRQKLSKRIHERIIDMSVAVDIWMMKEMFNVLELQRSFSFKRCCLLRVARSKVCTCVRSS
jgi:hypothetical protein